MSQAIRAAVVGAGLMGRWHADAIRRAGAVLTAIVDPDTAKAASLARRCGRPSVHPSLEPALTAGVEVVHVCTPLDTHVDLTMQALDARCHVLVEKPLAPDGEATTRLYHRARRAGVLLCPVHQFLFQRGIQRLEAAWSRVGPLRHIDTVACSAGAVGRAADQRDAVALDILPHPLSLVGRFLSLRDIEWSVVRPSPGELRVQGLGDAASISLLISMQGRPTRNTLRLIGEAGTVHVDLFHGFAVFEPTATSRFAKIARPFGLATRTLVATTANLVVRAFRRELAYPGLRLLVERFYSAIQGEIPLPIAPDEAMAVAAARDQILLVQRGMQRDQPEAYIVPPT